MDGGLNLVLGKMYTLLQGVRVQCMHMCTQSHTIIIHPLLLPSYPHYDGKVPTPHSSRFRIPSPEVDQYSSLQLKTPYASPFAQRSTVFHLLSLSKNAS